jgi:hypothetical protein
VEVQDALGVLPEALRAREPGKRARLTYVIGKYRSALEADFATVYPGLDLGGLWRSRNCRKLLNLIDHLPQNTWYHQAISEDVEHAMMLIKAREEAEKRGIDPPPSGPALRSWSPEVDIMTRVLDAVNNVAYVTGKASGGKGKPPKPAPRPPSAMERAKLRLRAERHAILVRRMLPHLADDD